MSPENWKTLKEVCIIATPFILFIASAIVIPIMLKIKRVLFLYGAKIESNEFANKTINGEFKGFSKEWTRIYDHELNRQLKEKVFVDGK